MNLVGWFDFLNKQKLVVQINLWFGLYKSDVFVSKQKLDGAQQLPQSG